MIDNPFRVEDIIMAKVPLEKEIDSIKIELAVEIQKHSVNQALLLEFIAARDADDPIAQGSLVDYVQEKFYKGQNVVVVPDLSGQQFGQQVKYEGERTEENLDRIREGYLDLSSIDFTGSNLKGATFTSCNLEGVSFCDSDLSGVFFDDCSMARVDMRGADISHCKFGEDAAEEFLDGNDSPLKPVEASEISERDKSARYADIYFSSAEPLLHQYRERNDDIIELAKEGFESDKADKLRRKDREIATKQEKIDEAWKGLSYIKRGYYTAGISTGNKEFDALVQEKAELDKQRKEIVKLDFDNDFDKSKIAYVVDPTIAELPLLMQENAENIRFDPAYVRGSSKKEQAQEKQYVRLTRQDAEEYIAAIKQNPELTLNDFAKTKIPLDQLKTGAKVVDDFSTPRAEDGQEYVGTAVDLSGLDFSKANLQESCFAGANLEKCKFNGANLSRATFEAANLRGTEFLNTNAKDATFFYSDMSPTDDGQKTKIIGSDFERAFMRGSEAVEAIVEKSNFNYSNIRNGNWDQAVIQEAHFDYADMEGISLAGAKLREVTMKHTLLDRAIMTNTELIKVDLTDAMMVGVKAEKLKIKDSILRNVDARGINLEGGEIDTLSKLEGLDLERALMEKIKADGVDFRKVNLEQADLRLAELRGANLEGVNARFANLEGAVMEGAKAAGIDMTGAQVEKLRAAKADLTKAVMQGVKGDEADFTDALLEGANLREAKMRKAIMERVDLRKAELQGAKLPEVNLTGAKVEGAEIDLSSDLHGAKIEGAKGNMKEEQPDGQVKEKPIEQVVKEHNEVHAAEQKSWLGKLVGNALKAVGYVCQKIGGIIKQPFSEKWGRIIGAVAGALIVGSIAVSAVATGGLSLVAIAGVIAGAAAVGAVAGAVAGHYGAKKITAIHLIGAGAGLAGGPIGVGVGLVVGEGVERVGEAVLGEKPSVLLGGGVEAIGRGIENVGKGMAVSPEVQLRMDERAKAEKLHVDLVKPELNREVDRSVDRERLDQRGKQSKKGLITEVPPPHEPPMKESARDIGTKQKEQEKQRADNPEKAKNKTVKKEKSVQRD